MYSSGIAFTLHLCILIYVWHRVLERLSLSLFNSIISLHTAYHDTGSLTFVQLSHQNISLIVCASNPCMNGGTCVADAVNYHCECPECWRGVCCNETVPSCNYDLPETTTLPPLRDPTRYGILFLQNTEGTQINTQLVW